jgi:hypothetical protein
MGTGTSGRGEVAGKVGQNCAHMHVNAKMSPVETIPCIRGVGMKERGGRDESKYDIFDTL